MTWFIGYFLMVLICWFVFTRKMLTRPERNIFDRGFLPGPEDPFFALLFGLAGAWLWPITLTGLGMHFLVAFSIRKRKP